MKDYLLIFTACSLLLCCDREPEMPNATVITMTTAVSSVGFNIEGSGTATIEWGDGTVRKIHSLTRNNSASYTIQWAHYYSDASAHTIQLTSANITEFACYYNELTALDISGWAFKITRLDCSVNQLTSLDVSGCVGLESLNCGSNLLTSLDVSKCTALKILNCSKNQLSADALDALFESLPRTVYAYPYLINVYGNPGANDCNKIIAENKGWDVIVE